MKDFLNHNKKDPFLKEARKSTKDYKNSLTKRIKSQMKGKPKEIEKKELREYVKMLGETNILSRVPKEHIKSYDIKQLSKAVEKKFKSKEHWLFYGEVMHEEKKHKVIFYGPTKNKTICFGAVKTGINECNMI